MSFHEFETYRGPSSVWLGFVCCVMCVMCVTCRCVKVSAVSLRVDRCSSQAPVRVSFISGHWVWRLYTRREKLMIWESTAATSVLRWASVTVHIISSAVDDYDYSLCWRLMGFTCSDVGKSDVFLWIWSLVHIAS